MKKIGVSPAPLGYVQGGLTALRELAPGVAISLTIAAAASFVAGSYGGPVMLLALLFGMALNFISDSPECAAGISFMSKRILRVGVALLGVRISLEQVLSLGHSTLEIIFGGVIVTVLTGIALARLARFRTSFGILIGGATAICGASAALAISSALPQTADTRRDTTFTVVAVTSLSTLAMIAYPVLFKAFGFNDETIGILIGATIHDVAQVVGAGYSVSDYAGGTATIVKLFRVALLVPLVLAVSVLFTRRSGAAAETNLPIPVFALGFVGLVGANSAGLLPASVVEVLGGFSQWCLIAAVAAIGLATSLRDTVALGFRPVLVAAGTTIVLVVFSVTAAGLAG